MAVSKGFLPGFPVNQCGMKRCIIHQVYQKEILYWFILLHFGFYL